MPMSNAEKLVSLGTPPDLAKEIPKVAVSAVALKPQIAALTPASTAADIVAALKA